jgi:hypothetical protein
MPNVRQRSEAIGVDRRQHVWRRLKDVAVCVDLHELAPVGGRAAGGRDWRRSERFAQVSEDLPDRPRLGDEGDQPDVAAARQALEGKLLSHPHHQFRPCNPGGGVRAGPLSCVAAAIRGLSANGPADSLPTGCGLTPPADVLNGERRDRPPQLLIQRKHPVIAMPALPRRRDKVRQTIEELKRLELDDAVGSRQRGLPRATPPDPVGRLVSGQHVKDATVAAVWAAAARRRDRLNHRINLSLFLSREETSPDNAVGQVDDRHFFARRGGCSLGCSAERRQERQGERRPLHLEKPLTEKVFAESY